MNHVTTSLLGVLAVRRIPFGGSPHTPPRRLEGFPGSTDWGFWGPRQFLPTLLIIFSRHPERAAPCRATAQLLLKAMVSTRTTVASNSVNALRKAQTRSARKRGCDDGAGVGGAGGGASATPHITAGGGNAGNAAHAQPTKRKRGAALTVVDAAGGGTCEGAIAASDATGVDAAGGGDAAQETSPVGLDTLAAVTATSSSSKKPLSWVEIVRMPVAKGDDAALTALKRSSGHALTKKRTRKVASDFLDKDGNALFNTVTEYKCLHNTRCGCPYRGKIERRVKEREYVISSAGSHDPKAHEKSTSSKGLSVEAKAEVRKGVAQNSTPTEILKSIRTTVSPSKLPGGLPTLKQVANCAKVVAKGGAKKPAFGNTMAELKDWIQSNSSIPTNEDSVYVVASETSNEDFRMFLTTPRLLRNVDAQTRATGGNMFIATDGTYKVNLEGRPLIPVGTLDADRHYRDVGVVLISGTSEVTDDFTFVGDGLWKGLENLCGFSLKEKTLFTMSDNARNIKRGLDASLAKLDEQPSHVRHLTCYTHLVRPDGALRKNKGKLVNAENFDDIRHDILQLHDVPAGLAHGVVDALFDALVMKWQDPAYGENDWCDWLTGYWRENVVWTRGFNLPGFAHHNQALERQNLTLKEDLNRQRFTFATFCTKVVRYIEQRSLEEKTKSWQLVPTVSAEDWREAQFHLKKEHVKYEVRTPFGVLYPTQNTFAHVTADLEALPDSDAIPGSDKWEELLREAITERAHLWVSTFLMRPTPRLTFDEPMKLLKAFWLVAPLQPGAAAAFNADPLVYSCTCVGWGGKGADVSAQQKRRTGYQHLGKCKHVLCHGIRTGVVHVPPDMKLGVVGRPRGHRVAQALPALVNQDED